MHALRLDWGHLHYRDEGARDGHAVVLLNSLGTDLRMWDALLPLLPLGLRFLRLDKRGHGLSARSDRAFGIDDLADDVRAVLDACGVARATVIGCSIGGLIAQSLHARMPDRVAALVLSNTASRIGTAESWAERIAQVRQDGLAAMAPAILARWFGPAFRATPEAALWQTMLSRCDGVGYAQCCAAIAEADYTRDLARIAVPTLVLAGAADGATPPDLVLDMARQIAGARADLIARAGHIPAVEAPAVCGALITAFLKEAQIV